MLCFCHSSRFDSVTGHCEFDFVILVDSSFSITSEPQGGHPDNWDKVLQMVRLLIESIDSYSTIGVTSRVAIINYSTAVKVVVDFSENLNKNELLALIDDGAIEHYKRATFMTSAVLMAMNLLKQNIRYVSGDITATQAVILFTDGQASIESQQTHTLSDLLKQLVGRDQAHVMMVGK